jgi:hypothetical protein
MTPQQTQEVKEKIIEAVPEIMELKFGCKIETNKKYSKEFYLGKFSERSYIFCGSNGEFCETYPESKNNIKILGRPIQLADILIAINQKKPRVFIQLDQDGVIYKGEYECMDTVLARWDLSKDFDNQSDETKTFIYNILIN